MKKKKPGGGNYLKEALTHHVKIHWSCGRRGSNPDVFHIPNRPRAAAPQRDRGLTNIRSETVRKTHEGSS